MGLKFEQELEKIVWGVTILSFVQHGAVHPYKHTIMYDDATELLLFMAIRRRNIRRREGYIRIKSFLSCSSFTSMTTVLCQSVGRSFATL